MKIQVFDNAAFLKAQADDALTSPLNRHATRVKKGLPDEKLTKNDLLLHYVENGGATRFAKFRCKFMRVVDFPYHNFYIFYEI